MRRQVEVGEGVGYPVRSCGFFPDTVREVLAEVDRLRAEVAALTRRAEEAERERDEARRLADDNLANGNAVLDSLEKERARRAALAAERDALADHLRDATKALEGALLAVQDLHGAAGYAEYRRGVGFDRWLNILSVCRAALAGHGDKEIDHE